MLGAENQFSIQLKKAETVGVTRIVAWNEGARKEESSVLEKFSSLSFFLVKNLHTSESALESLSIVI